MENKLKNLRAAMDKTVFKGTNFTEKQKNQIRRSIVTTRVSKKRLNWFPKTLAIAFYAGILLVGGQFIWDEINDSGDDTSELSSSESYQVDSLNNVSTGASTNIPFSVKKPAFIPDGLKPVKMQTQDINEASGSLTVVSQGWVDVHAEDKPKYKQKELLITESKDNGGAKPTNVLSEGRKIQIAGVDAWVLNEKLEDPTQIMFWKDGIYYNVRGQNIKIDTLIKTANSLFN